MAVCICRFIPANKSKNEYIKDYHYNMNMNKTPFTLVLLFICLFPLEPHAQSYLCGDAGENSCNLLWEDRDYGTYIGEYNSILSYDVDNDGVDEIIGCSRFSYQSNS